MKKLFLPLALLTMSAVYAQDDSVISSQPTADEIQAMLQSAGDQLAANLLQDPALADWYNNASDSDVQAFNDLCVQYATLNINAYSQYAASYSQIFDALSDLTGRTSWSVQINFISNDLAQALQAQQSANQEAPAASVD